MQIKFMQRVYWRLALGLFFVFFSFTLFVGWVVSKSSQEQSNLVAQQMHQDLAAHVVDHYLFFKDGEIDLKQAKHTFHDLMILGPNFEFYVLDKAGKILTYSAEKHRIKRTHVSPDSMKPLLGKVELNKPIYGEDPRGEDRYKPFSVSAIKDVNGEVQGYLYVIVGSEIRDSIAGKITQDSVAYWVLLTVGLGAIGSFIIVLLVARVVTKPLSRLTQQVKKVRALGFTKPTEADALAELKTQIAQWQGHSANEIHLLGNAFSDLLAELERQYQHVVEVDEMRKELLTHISHDLRTPLASLMGYLETWELNKSSTSPEQLEQYISIARRNAERVSKLVSQLFELANLDSGKVDMRMEPFAIAELAQDVIQKLSLQAQEKGLSLSLEPKDSRISVMADIEKLERVFTNLIENAIRHSQKGGEIKIKFNSDGKAVAIEVQDNGVGIPQEDLPKVFNAHYKAGNSVRGDTAHGGIGLAITKKIINLHNSSIDVMSKVNEGTVFRFTLPSPA